MLSTSLMSTFQISKFGGLTRAKQAVELCSSLGIAMTIEVNHINIATIDTVAIIAMTIKVFNLYFHSFLKYKKSSKKITFKYHNENFHACNAFLTSMVSIVYCEGLLGGRHHHCSHTPSRPQVPDSIILCHHRF